MNQQTTSSINTTDNTSMTPSPKVAFIAAQWHSNIVDKCREGFVDEFTRLGHNTALVDFYTVPGAFDIPLLVKKLAESENYEAIVATGFIVDGGIYRHDFVSSAVIDGLMRVQLDTGVPVISAVLTPHNFQETEPHEKFFRDHFVIKGGEAARACSQIIANVRQVAG